MAKRKQPPLLDLGRPAVLDDIFDWVVAGPVYLLSRVRDPRWVFICGAYVSAAWRSVYGLPKPEVARLLPPWAYSIVRYNDRLVVEDMLLAEARYLCACDPRFGIPQFHALLFYSLD